MDDRLCEGCGQPLVGEGHSNRRHHGGPCRKKSWKRRQLERQAPELTPPEPTNAEPTSALDQQAVLEEAMSEPRLIAYVARAAMGNWRAAAWLLEHRHAERWGSGRQPEPTGASDATVAAVLRLVPRGE
jgi:hypothetical protein